MVRLLELVVESAGKDLVLGPCCSLPSWRQN